MRPILFDEPQEGIAVLTINRPKVRNALNWEAMEAFAEAVETAHKKKDLRALIVTGKDIAFCAGGDLYELHGYPSRHDGLRLADAMGVTLERLGDLPCPIYGRTLVNWAGRFFPERSFTFRPPSQPSRVLR